MRLHQRPVLASISASIILALAGAASAVPPLQHYYGVLPTTGAFQTYTDQITANSQVKWYAFTLTDSISAIQGTYLDIDTNANPVQAPAMTDTVMAVYNAAGQYVTSDDDHGTGNRSQISFGAGSRSAPGDGFTYSGQNGATLDAAQGPFFIAVCGYQGNFAPNFGATSNATELGYFTLGMRTGKMPGFLPAVNVDLGNIRGHRSAMSTGPMAVDIGDVKWVKFHVDQATDASAIYCDIQTAGSSLPVANGSFLDDTELALFRSDGTVVSGAANGNADDWSFGGGSRQGGASFGRTSGARNYGTGLSNFAGQTAAVLTPGDYYVAVGAYNLVPQIGFIAGSDTDAQGTVTLNVLTNIAPAQDYDMGLIRSLNSPSTTTDIPLNDGETKWYRFQIEQPTSAATTYCDIHTAGSDLVSGSGSNDDTILAIYNTSGVRMGFNDDWIGRTTGGNESGLSFGRTSGPRSYGGMPNFAGLDGAVLPAGVYYVAVSGYDGNYTASSDYRLASPHNRHGKVRLTIATNIGQGLTSDLGVVSRFNSPVAAASIPVPDLGVKWIHFKTAHATNDTDLFLDIHTLGSVFTTGPSAGDDTEIGLFDSAGMLIANDDDWMLGTPNRLEAVLTFGATSSPRAYGPLNNLAGQSGGTLWAGDYYIAIAGFDVSFGQGFTVTPNNGSAGTAVVNIITNLPAIPCNAADVASLGGVIGADHQLTVDDIVVYLSVFFANNLAVADIAGLGGTPGPDGIITVDDLVIFLAAFFSPCNP